MSLAARGPSDRLRRRGLANAHDQELSGRALRRAAPPTRPCRGAPRARTRPRGTQARRCICDARPHRCLLAAATIGAATCTADTDEGAAARGRCGDADKQAMLGATCALLLDCCLFSCTFGSASVQTRSRTNLETNMQVAPQRSKAVLAACAYLVWPDCQIMKSYVRTG